MHPRPPTAAPQASGVLGTVKQIARRFEVASLGDSYCVEDFDGRPVTPSLSYREAAEATDRLNAAAAGGRKGLAFALGAYENDEQEAWFA